MHNKLAGRALVASIALACLTGTPATAQEAGQPAGQVEGAAEQGPYIAPAQGPSVAPEGTEAPCQPKKKKKGFGLGGLLRAAQASGLSDLAGAGTFGRGGAVASAVVGTAAGVSDAAAANAARREASPC